MVTLRPADGDDARFVWETRNEETVRAQSMERDLISWAHHMRWWGGNIPHTRIIECDGTRVGYIRTSPWSISSTISIALIQSARGRGVGVLALRAIQREAVRSGRRVLDAYIDLLNIASRKAFAHAGFVEEPNMLLHTVVHVLWEGACRYCAAGEPHHTNATSSIAGPEGRAPRYDLHDLGSGGLVECEAAGVWDEALA